MRAGFSWMLGRPFWDELVLLRRTERSPEEVTRVRRERLLGVLRGVTGGAAEREPEEVLRRLQPAGRRQLGTGLTWRRRTSGSSGHAVAVSVGRATYARVLAGFWRGMAWWGVTPGDPGLSLLGAEGPALRRRLLRVKDRLLGVHRVLVEEGEAWVAEARDALRSRAFAYVYGYPSALYELALTGSRPHRPPRVVVTTGEPLFGFQRRAIEEAFGSRVAEEFGCTELGTVAFQCPAGSLHLAAEQVWLEQVDRRTLATSLLPRPVPVVRYRLDEPVAEEGGPCPCGLALPRAVLLRRRADAWQRFEEAAWQAATRVGLPTRFTVDLHGQAVRVPAGTPAAQTRLLATALGPGAGVEQRDHLPRRAAGKFSYLEGARE
jgi:hypothetical protein